MAVFFFCQACLVNGRSQIGITKILKRQLLSRRIHAACNDVGDCCFGETSYSSRSVGNRVPHHSPKNFIHSARQSSRVVYGPFVLLLT